MVTESRYTQLGGVAIQNTRHLSEIVLQRRLYHVIFFFLERKSNVSSFKIDYSDLRMRHKRKSRNFCQQLSLLYQLGCGRYRERGGRGGGIEREVGVDRKKEREKVKKERERERKRERERERERS